MKLIAPPMSLMGAARVSVESVGTRRAQTNASAAVKLPTVGICAACGAIEQQRAAAAGGRVRRHGVPQKLNIVWM